MSILDPLNKSAKVVEINGEKWLINGTWSAGGRYPKKPNFKKAAKEDLFDPYKTSAIWLKDSEQVGWFVSDSKIPPSKALAAIVLNKLQLNSVPWRGVFKLDGGRWIVGVDDSISLHPLWDIWVSDEDYHSFDVENSSKWMTFKNGIETNSDEESVEWLFQDGFLGNQYKVSPVTGNESLLKTLGISFSVFLIVLLAGLFALHKWEDHLAEVKLKLKEQTLANQRAEMLADRENKKNEKSQYMLEAKKYWESMPRPWVKHISWDSLASRCEVENTKYNNVFGWEKKFTVCDVNPSINDQVELSKGWSRGPLATIKQAPEGKISDKSNSIVNTTNLNIRPLTYASEEPLPSLKGGVDFWTAEHQKWKGIVHIYIGKPTFFRPSVPVSIPKKERLKIHPPVLWSSFIVTIATSYKPQTLKFWNKNGFVPHKILIDTSNGSTLYIIKGIQYANQKV